MPGVAAYFRIDLRGQLKAQEQGRTRDSGSRFAAGGTLSPARTTEGPVESPQLGFSNGQRRAGQETRMETETNRLPGRLELWGLLITARKQMHGRGILLELVPA